MGIGVNIGYYIATVQISVFGMLNLDGLLLKLPLLSRGDALKPHEAQESQSRISSP